MGIRVKFGSHLGEIMRRTTVEKAAHKFVYFRGQVKPDLGIKI
jgi:hypothetical protein